MLQFRCYHVMIFICLISAVVYLLFSYVIFAVILIVIYAHCSYARAVPFYTHTHHGRVLTTLDLHVQILDGLQVFVEDVRFCE